MKIKLIRADAGGCAFYRMQEPGRVVSAQYDDVEITVQPHVDVEATQDANTREVTVHEVTEDADLLVIQRPLKAHLLKVAEQAQKQGIAVAVEIDDHFGAVHPLNKAYKYTRPENFPLENYQWLERITAVADLVIVSTPLLADYYAPHGRSVVVRNCVPESIKDTKRTSAETTRVGWTGTLQTHPTDLQATGGGVIRAVQESSASMYVVGDSYGINAALGEKRFQAIPMSGWVPLNNYYDTIAQNVDVGIVPLDLIAFNDAKSALKGLEFAALGIPFVASPTDEYKMLAAQGVGEIATNSGEWRKKLNVWLNSGRKRTADGQRYRDIVLSSMTYEANAWRWHDAWQQAIENGKNRDDR